MFAVLNEDEKNKKLVDLLDVLDFNQVVIFVKTALRAKELARLLKECNFPAVAVHGMLKQDERCLPAFSPCVLGV